MKPTLKHNSCLWRCFERNLLGRTILLFLYFSLKELGKFTKPVNACRKLTQGFKSADNQTQVVEDVVECGEALVYDPELDCAFEIQWSDYQCWQDLNEIPANEPTS